MTGKNLVTPATARRPALFIVLGAGRGGQRGRAGRYRGMPPPARPGTRATKMQEPGRNPSRDVLWRAGAMLCSALPSLSPSNLSVRPGSNGKSPVTASACTRLGPLPLILAASDSPCFTPSSSYANSPHPRRHICFCTAQRRNSLVLAGGAACNGRALGQWAFLGSVTQGI